MDCGWLALGGCALEEADSVERSQDDDRTKSKQGHNHENLVIQLLRTRRTHIEIMDK